MSSEEFKRSMQEKERSSQRSSMISDVKEDEGGEEKSAERVEKSKLTLIKNKQRDSRRKPSASSSSSSSSSSSTENLSSTTSTFPSKANSSSSTPASSNLPSSLPSREGKFTLAWECQSCHQACIPIRSESRCLCGHRYKEHRLDEASTGSSQSLDKVKFKCGARSCACQHFYFIVAEGAWILRCRCKHKHIDHDASGHPFKCKKPRCECNGFDSPWVCNCGHPWSSHVQKTLPASKPSGLIAQALEFHRQQADGNLSQVPTGQGEKVDVADMVGLMTDESAMKDLDMNVRRDGCS